MLKNTTNQEKFAMLGTWFPRIIDSIKKDLKSEHLKKDWGFLKEYFPGKNPNKLTTEEIAEAYRRAIANGENAEDVGEFVANRWLLKHSDLYYHFEKELSKISADFSEIEELDKESSRAIMEKAIGEFGAPNTYLFCIFNSVVFPKEIYDELAKRAQGSAEEEETKKAFEIEQESKENLHRSFEQQIARLTDKYEKKLSGLQKKYATDVEALKKQIANLQRKLSSNT